MTTTTNASDWDWERYRKILQLVLRVTQLDPRLRRRFDSSDLVQETLAKAFAAWQQCKGQSDGERIAWLKKILKNVEHDLLDKELANKRGPGIEQSIHDLVEASSVYLDALLPDDKQSTPGERLQRAEELLRVAEAMAELSEAQRDVIILRYYHGQTVAEVADKLDLSPKAVAGKYQRGIHQLRQRLAYLRE
jgi:RNA polymerase sigma-70 factor (ECF subfamily)